MEFSEKELEILLEALYCYGREIDHEDDNNHTAFMALNERIKSRYYGEV